MRFPLLIFVAGCATSPPPPPPLPPTTIEHQTGGLEHGMANCPATLPTAITRVADAPGGVDVTITVSDPEAHRRLLALAEIHARIGGADPGEPEHSGMHGGPGEIGHCPIIHTATQIQAAQIPHGIRFEVRTLPGGDVEKLRRDTRRRASNLPRRLAWF